MLALPLRTPLLKAHDDLAGILASVGEIRGGDILVVSSKAVATCEGRGVDLSRVSPSRKAEGWAKATGRSPSFIQAVLDEVAFRKGKIVGSCEGALLTELRPEGLTQGSILVANAGLDESNVAPGFAIGWPRDPIQSVRQLRYKLQTTHYKLAVILSDSCLRPRRVGVTAFALVSAGLDPLRSDVGKEDLFGKKLRHTVEATADQLAVAANFLMGNAAQSVPAVLICDHGLPLSDFEGWVPGIEESEDIFRGLLGPSP